MARRDRALLTGSFVIGAVVLSIIAVLIWGSRSLFERKYEYVCYFAGSVRGLTRGADVEYEGVVIGQVKDIRIRYHQAPEDTRIPVFIEVWGKHMRELGTPGEPTAAAVRDLVARGLRARLEQQSLVTGLLYVSMQRIPGSPASFAELPNGRIPEIPTLPTEQAQAMVAVNELLKNLGSTDFKGMTDSISSAARDADQLLRAREIQRTLQSLPGLMAAGHRLLGTLDDTAAKTGVVVEGAHGLLAPHAPLAVDLRHTLSELDKAAAALRELADFLRRNPHALVAGTKPAETTQ